jgi:predicted Fe-S protein YdhL (DUF1289 family)
MMLAYKLIERAQQAQDKSSVVASPCNSVCTLNPLSGFCNGCLRSLSEIADWSAMSDEDKRQVWRQIDERARSPAP